MRSRRSTIRHHQFDQAAPVADPLELGNHEGMLFGVFTCTQSQHGGEETMITSLHPTLLHHGMDIVGLPYTAAGIRTMPEVTGGTPDVASIVRDLVAGYARGAR